MREIDARGMRERCFLLCLIVVGGASHALATSGGYLISCLSSYLIFMGTPRLPRFARRLATLRSPILVPSTETFSLLACAES